MRQRAGVFLSSTALMVFCVIFSDQALDGRISRGIWAALTLFSVYFAIMFVYAFFQHRFTDFCKKLEHSKRLSTATYLHRLSETNGEPATRIDNLADTPLWPNPKGVQIYKYFPLMDHPKPRGVEQEEDLAEVEKMWVHVNRPNWALLVFFGLTKELFFGPSFTSYVMPAVWFSAALMASYSAEARVFAPRPVPVLYSLDQIELVSKPRLQQTLCSWPEYQDTASQIIRVKP